MSVLANPVLVLNNAFEPINICTARRAMVLVMKGAAVVQENSDLILMTPRISLPLPSVVRLLKYRRVPRHSRSVSRKNIFIRDGYTCQYCSAQLPGGRLTLDHVNPRSQGGRSTWENLVAACYSCNNRKGDKTPETAGMVLLKRPVRFGVHDRHRLIGAPATSGGLSTCSSSETGDLLFLSN